MDISYIMGIMSVIIFLYRLVYLLIPMLLKGIKESTKTQQGGTKLKKHQEINKQLKKRSIRKR